MALGERGTAVLAAAVRPSCHPRGHGEGGAALPQTPHSCLSRPQELVPSGRRRRQVPALVEPLELSITLSPYASVTSPLFLRSLRGGEAEGYWLSRQPRPGANSVRDPLRPQTKIKAE